MWTCRIVDNPQVTELLDEPPGTATDWAHRLERDARDAVDGKVLCACAALSIARSANASRPLTAHSEKALSLLDQWIDDPTDARFDQSATLLFAEGAARSQPELDEISWWACRVATASVGNFEAGWALRALCEHAEKLGLAPEEVRTRGLAAAKARLI